MRIFAVSWKLEEIMNAIVVRLGSVPNSEFDAVLIIIVREADC
jgi:hypothetical protein